MATARLVSRAAAVGAPFHNEGMEERENVDHAVLVCYVLVRPPWLCILLFEAMAENGPSAGVQVTSYHVGHRRPSGPRAQTLLEPGRQPASAHRPQQEDRG